MALVRQLLLSLKSTCSWRSLLKFSGLLRPAE
jgi:hypothetical protein